MCTLTQQQLLSFQRASRVRASIDECLCSARILKGATVRGRGDEYFEEVYILRVDLK